MGGGDDKVTLILAGKVFAYALQGFHFIQDALNGDQNPFAWLSEGAYTFAMASKNLYAQLIFEFNNGLGYSRL